MKTFVCRFLTLSNLNDEFVLPKYEKQVSHLYVYFHFLQIYDNYYRFKKIGLPQKSTVPNEIITQRLLKEDQASAVDQYCVYNKKTCSFKR